MRASIPVLLALFSCSCATVHIVKCGDCVPSLGPRGITVISDIDDTIKDTHVKLGRTHVPNPAIVLDGLRLWHPVKSMVQRYLDWAKDGKTIVYLSAGPCRYKRRLRREIPKWGFPKGLIVLRKGGLIPPHDYKTRAIQPIINDSKGHHFVLIGDSGEHDPECYGDLAREFPEQVDHIYIRNISDDDPARYEWAFRGIAKEKIDLISPDLTGATSTAQHR